MNDSNDGDALDYSSLDYCTTGLPFRIYVLVNIGAADVKPHLVVCAADGLFYRATLDDPAEILPETGMTLAEEEISALLRFIAANREVLLRYWNDEIDTVEMLGLIQPA